MNSADNDLIDELRTGRLKAYEAAPGHIREHFGIEETVLAGGYGYRQILELVQNGAADAILEAHEDRAEHATIPDRMEVLLRGSHLYVANTGAPLSRDGAESLLRSPSSPKRGNQIGRFGLGSQSLLGLQGKIDVFSSTFAFRFAPERCRTLGRLNSRIGPAGDLCTGCRGHRSIKRTDGRGDRALRLLGQDRALRKVGWGRF